ncbi:MAG: TonB-dependent receptor [Aquabacterium sp.]|nr:TonB-dependent receptor [Aquabacterium sp.]
MPRHFNPRPHTIAAVVAALFLPAVSSAQQAQAADPQQVTISGNGRGQSRQVEAISSVELSQLPPGASPLLAVARLPSVNFQSADSFGAYEWSTRITVRGFNQNQLGFTLDDVPLGDMSYANFNGLHISRAIATENIGRAVLSAGTGSLSTASSSNLGGTLQFYSNDPSDKFGGSGAIGMGSNKNTHLFARLDTGQTGFGKAYLSVSDQSSDKWKGNGQQKQQQLNAKYVLQTGDTKVSAFANLSKRQEIDYQDMSHEMIARLGEQFDNTYPDFAAAVKIATNKCGNTVNGVPSTYSGACDDAYYAGSGLRNDELYGASVATRVGQAAQLKATVYHHNNKGAGLWYTPYTASPNGTPIALRTTEYGINRDGLVATGDYALGQHQLRAGLWLETNKFDQARRFYATSPANVPSPYAFPTNPFFTQWQYGFKTNTSQFSLEDAFALNASTNVNIGFKSVDVKTTATRQIGAADSNPQGTIRARKAFLPQLGLTMALDASSELFAGYAQNMRAYQSSRTAGPFSTTQAGFDAIAAKLKPETSQTLEAGWRLNTRQAEAVVAVYAVKFKDRLLAVQQGAGIVGNPAVLSNVGDAQMLGLEASGALRLGGGVSWFNGISLNKSEYKSDTVSDGVKVATNGKTIVDTPSMLFKSVLSYDNGPLFANLGMEHMGKRYYTYLNDGAVDGRTLFNASAGYRLGSFGGLRDLTAQLTVSNLSNQRHIATIGSNGFVNSDTTGSNQTILPGAPRAMFLSLSAKL